MPTERMLQMARVRSFKTDCPECFGTGWAHPTLEATHACSNGCNDWAEPGQQFAGVDHPQVLLEVGSLVAWVDFRMADPLRRLWEAGVATWVSCQGCIGTDCEYSESHTPYLAITSGTPEMVAATLPEIEINETSDRPGLDTVIYFRWRNG